MPIAALYFMNWNDYIRLFVITRIIGSEFNRHLRAGSLKDLSLPTKIRSVYRFANVNSATTKRSSGT